MRMTARFVKQHLWWMTCILGVAGYIASFLYEAVFAGIPYQDPTPELQRNYDFHVQVARDLYQFGATLVGAGLVLGAYRALTRR